MPQPKSLQPSLRALNGDPLTVCQRRSRQPCVLACECPGQEGKFAKALDLLRRVEQFLLDDVDMDRNVRTELRALLDDAFAFYYFRRDKYEEASLWRPCFHGV